MSSRHKKLSKEEETFKKRNYLQALNDVAMQEDLEHRFGEYETDPSVGNMYQRKKKPSKTKSKRKSKKKGCGCK